MTIYDIAKLAGVSTATVSRVLNGGKSVSEETRQAVMHVIRQNDYQPSAIARGLSLKTMSMIGILAADCQSVFLSMAIHHLENFLRDSIVEGDLHDAGLISQVDEEKASQISSLCNPAV